MTSEEEKMTSEEEQEIEDSCLVDQESDPPSPCAQSDSTIGEEDNEQVQTNSKERVRKKKKRKYELDPSTTPGIVYLSSIPPFMKPHKVRHLLSQYGTVGRIYLQPEDAMIRKRRRKFGGNKKVKFTEGWVEFQDKRVAKAVARALNSTPVGFKKRSYYHDDLWNIKYLTKFRWTHLTEKIAYEQAVREQKMRTEMSQAKKESAHYLANVEKGKEIEAIVQRKRKRGDIDDQTPDGLQRNFKQRRVNESAAKMTQGRDIPSSSQRKVVASSPSASSKDGAAKGRLSDSLLRKIFS